MNYDKNIKKIVIITIFCLILVITTISVIVIDIYDRPNLLSPYEKQPIKESNVNGIFEPYIGMLKGTVVKNLLGEINTFNMSNNIESAISLTYLQEHIDKKSDSEYLAMIMEKINKNSTYEINCNYSDKGIINEIIIKNVKYEDLEKTPLDYNFAQMVEDKCYIVTNSNTVYHIQELDKFIENVGNNIPDEIRIVEYTDEDQPILIDFKYADNKFILKIDTRRDGYAGDENKNITITEYDASKYELIKENIPQNITKLKTYYPLILKSKETKQTISVCNYAEINKASNEKFKIQFNADSITKKTSKILGKEETDKYDYDIYAYKGTVSILINGEEMSLREALINNKITAEEILEKAYKDAKEDEIIFGDVYLDGGSSFYIYNDYQILKCNIIPGIDEEEGYIKDLYIGVPSMYISDVRK